jgi:hypothetical protein
MSCCAYCMHIYHYLMYALEFQSGNFQPDNQPGFGFQSSESTGFERSGYDEISFVYQGAKRLKVNPTSTTIFGTGILSNPVFTGAISASSMSSLSSASASQLSSQDVVIDSPTTGTIDSITVSSDLDISDFDSTEFTTTGPVQATTLTFDSIVVTTDQSIGRNAGTTSLSSSSTGVWMVAPFNVAGISPNWWVYDTSTSYWQYTGSYTATVSICVFSNFVASASYTVGQAIESTTDSVTWIVNYADYRSISATAATNAAMSTTGAIVVTPGMSVRIRIYIAASTGYPVTWNPSTGYGPATVTFGQCL